MKIIIKQPLYLYAALLLLLAGCKLDKPDFHGYKPIGDTTGTGTVVSNPGDTYQPVTKGSNWTYLDEISGVTDTVTTTITGGTIVLNGRTYYAGLSEEGGVPDTGYLSRDNHIYTSLSLTGGVDIELYYLNDTTAVGHGWTAPVNSTGSILGVPGQFVGTVVGINLVKTVGGKTFTSVIHTRVNLQYDYGSGFSTYITYDTYIAKNIGIIEVDSNGAGLTGVETILNYSIK